MSNFASTVLSKTRAIQQRRKKHRALMAQLNTMPIPMSDVVSDSMRKRLPR